MDKTGIIIRESFYFFSLALLGALILEYIFPNIILAYFNLNYLLILILLSGALALANKYN